MEGLSISRFAKLQKYEKGQNFSRFCEKFNNFVTLTQMNTENQYAFFMQNVDDQTYSILKSVRVSDEQKADKALFCALFKRAIYGEESLSLKNEVRDCKQKSSESIADYVYRLREKASIAYPDADEAEENCLLSFLRGVSDANIRRKLNEATITNFEQAVKLAKKLVRVNQVFENEADCSQVLTSRSMSFSDQNSDDDIRSRENDSLDRSRPRNRENIRDKYSSNYRSDSRGRYARSSSRELRFRDDRRRSRFRDGYSRSIGSNRQGSRRGPWTGRCFACGMFGHYRSNCPNMTYHHHAQHRAQCCSTSQNSATNTQNNFEPRQQNF